MPVNNGSNLRVETNIQGNIVDNDEWINTKSYIEHHNTDLNSEQLNTQALEDLYNPRAKTVRDKRIAKANSKDLRNRSIPNQDQD